MKTLVIALGTLAASLFSSVTSFASEGDNKKACHTITSAEESTTTSATFKSNIFQNAAGRVTVIILKEDQETVKLSITDQNNQELFRSKIKDDSVHQNFTMKGLEPGEYRFTLNKNGECFTKTVTVK